MGTEENTWTRPGQSGGGADFRGVEERKELNLLLGLLRMNWVDGFGTLERNQWFVCLREGDNEFDLYHIASEVSVGHLSRFASTWEGAKENSGQVQLPWYSCLPTTAFSFPSHDFSCL